MNYTALFFLCVRMFHFIHADRLSFLMQSLKRAVAARKEHPEKRQVIIVDGSSSIFVLYLVLDFFFMLYCIWLMFFPETWTPGFLLLIIATMEPTAISSRISGTYNVDESGFVYPRTWFRYLTFGESMYILLRLFEG